MKVNLSVVQLLQKDVVGTVARILKKTGVKPRNIVLEITESFAINLCFCSVPSGARF